MNKLPASQRGADLLCLVPAAGKGTRLGSLTTHRAKPSLAITYDKEGDTITRMIDIPLRAVRQLGGKAVISLGHAAESLDFVKTYADVTTVYDTGPSTPAQTLLNNLSVLEGSPASVVGIVPADAYVDVNVLEGMLNVLDTQNADAVILATRKLAGHMVHAVGHQGLMTSADKSTAALAGLGIHMIRRSWLEKRLICGREAKPMDRQATLWEDVYDIANPQGNIVLHVPQVDTGWVDMGTPVAFFRVTQDLNKRHMDKSGNVIFPGASLSGNAVSTVALPNSNSSLAHYRAIIPEGAYIQTESEVVTL